MLIDQRLEYLSLLSDIIQKMLIFLRHNSP